MKKERRPKTAAMETWLTPSEAAHLMNCHTNTLAAWRRNKTGPAFTQHGPRCIRYRMSDLLDHREDISA